MSKQLTSAKNKHAHADRRAAKDGAHEKEADEGEEDALAAESLDEAADEGQDCSRRDGVCAPGPDEVVPVKLVDYGRECCGDGGLCSGVRHGTMKHFREDAEMKAERTRSIAESMSTRRVERNTIQKVTPR